MSVVRVRTEYLHPWPNAVGVYLARDRNLFSAHGLDVEITVGDPARGDAAAHLDRGEVDFGFVPPNRLLAQRERGVRIVGVAAINQRPLESLISITRHGIERPSDAVGKRVGFAPSPRIAELLRTAVRADGGDPDAVEIVDTGVYEPSIADVVAGRYDAVINIKAWEPLLADIPREERVVLPFDEWGGPIFPAYLLAVHETVLERNPELIRIILAGLQAGYRAAATEPEAAVAAIAPALPHIHADILGESLALVAPSWTHDGRWGSVRQDLLGPYAGWLHERGLIGGSDLPPGAVTDEFLPSVG